MLTSLVILYVGFLVVEGVLLSIAIKRPSRLVYSLLSSLCILFVSLPIIAGGLWLIVRGAPGQRVESLFVGIALTIGGIWTIGDLLKNKSKVAKDQFIQTGQEDRKG